MDSREVGYDPHFLSTYKIEQVTLDQNHGHQILQAKRSNKPSYHFVYAIISGSIRQKNLYVHLSIIQRKCSNTWIWFIPKKFHSNIPSIDFSSPIPFLSYLSSVDICVCVYIYIIIYEQSAPIELLSVYNQVEQGRRPQTMASPTTGLQRSSISFRRQGSSGLVWEDKRTISGEQSQPKSKQTNDHQNHQLKAKEQRITSGSTPAVTMDRIRSGGERRWRSGKALPAVDPPSPRVSGCGFCGVFGNKLEGQKKQKQRRRR